MSSAPIISGMQIVAEGPGQHRNDHQEDHHRGVHGEEHRVELGGDLSSLVREEQPPKNGMSDQGKASCQRTPSASAPPTISISIVVKRNWMPMTLWSVEKMYLRRKLSS